MRGTASRGFGRSPSGGGSCAPKSERDANQKDVPIPELIDSLRQQPLIYLSGSQDGSSPDWRVAAGSQTGGVRRWRSFLTRVWLNVNTDNLASLRVAHKAGFVREGTLRRASLEEDGLHDVAVLALLDDEI